MSDKNHILRQAKQDVYNALEGIIKFYNMKGASYSALKKYYKKKKNFDEILEDIRNKAINLFPDENTYKKFTREVLMDMLDDRIAHEKDKKKITEMKHLKAFENYDEVGQLLLYYGDDSPTTWFYIEDAIIDGLLDEKWQLDENIVEEIGQTCFYEDMTTQGDLALIIEQDFEGSLQRIFEFLIQNQIIENEVSVRIEGEDENGEKWNLSYEPY